MIEAEQRQDCILLKPNQREKGLFVDHLNHHLQHCIVEHFQTQSGPAVQWLGQLVAPGLAGIGSG